ncbi:hypothetical protein [uncultured Methylibium sp.]|uniref:hypothetical protein n=1 Tax=uncultured Methylibium sp. TaxID=381093 RepID=UPI0025D94D88|nr:hypothetical protein [uncultured Methylibium sp.]
MRSTAAAIALRAAAVWLLILVCAVANGALRETLLVPWLGRPAALVLSGLLLSACVLAAARLLVAWLPPLPARHLAGIGLGWLAATLAFEFGFGRVVQGKAWVELVEAHRFHDGNLWPVVLLVVLVAPWWAARWRR